MEESLSFCSGNQLAPTACYCENRFYVLLVPIACLAARWGGGGGHEMYAVTFGGYLFMT